MRYIERLPLPPRDEGAANERGLVFHKGAEDFVFNDGELLPGLKKFEQQLNDAREVHLTVPGAVHGERPLFFDSNWKPTDEKNKWLTIIPDLTLVVPRECNLTVDYKTGKRYGNEIKHHGQGQMYAIGQLCSDPSVITSYSIHYTKLYEVTAETVKNYIEMHDERIELGPVQAKLFRKGKAKRRT